MRGVSAESLVDLVVQTLKSDVRPGISADARYALAMSVRALEIARREMLGDPESAQWELLDHVYDAGEGTTAGLALDIRHGRVSDTTHADLRQRLILHLTAELEVRNPQVLKARGEQRL
ncbi:MAG: DUF6285 domain-containing protein [Hyphomicrobiaceae bacterium]